MSDTEINGRANGVVLNIHRRAGDYIAPTFTADDLGQQE